MQQLIDIGLLERTATKVVVRSITLTDIAEIFQIREAIEIMSVKIILSRGGLNETQKLELMDIVADADTLPEQYRKDLNKIIMILITLNLKSIRKSHLR